MSSAIRLDGDDAELAVIAPNGLRASCETTYTANFANSDTVKINPLEKQLAQCPGRAGSSTSAGAGGLRAACVSIGPAAGMGQSRPGAMKIPGEPFFPDPYFCF